MNDRYRLIRENNRTRFLNKKDRIIITFKNRLLSYIKIPNENGCMLWSGVKKPNGYGCFTFNKKSHNAHRLAYEYFIGKIPEKMQVLHKCDNRDCMSPDHLFIGTQLDNVKDMFKKGRIKGKVNLHIFELKDDEIQKIKNEIILKILTYEEICKKYNVTNAIITKIKKTII